MKHLELGKQLTLNDIKFFLQEQPSVVLSSDARSRIQASRQWLDRYLLNNEKPIYGVNTGFGSLCNVRIPQDELEHLQENLIMSHSCAVGDEVPEDVVRLMMLLKIQNAAAGYSSIQSETIDLLLFFLNHHITPVVYSQGSLGASGDLAPLAQMCLPLIGKGFVTYKQNKLPAQQVLSQHHVKPIKLRAKEGLALLNGTQYMQAWGLYNLIKAYHVADWADVVAAISLDAYMGLLEPFAEAIHRLRPHQGQVETARRIRSLLQNSEIQKISKDYVQDPYSFRCIPQVHGASRDVLSYVRNVLEIEMNAVTDNPTVFPEYNQIISAGNFHGQPLALALDFLAIACAELASISERRIYRLIEGKRNLPSYLVAHPGLNSGFMIAQYTAAALVSENKILCHPASVDSIESSQGQEDHVSMGANAALKLHKVIQNVFNVLSIEMLTACQALEFRRPLKTSPILEEIILAYRKNIPFVNQDTMMYPLIQQSKTFLESNLPPQI